MVVKRKLNFAALLKVSSFIVKTEIKKGTAARIFSFQPQRIFNFGKIKNPVETK